jgi:hypothetical protein
MDKILLNYQHKLNRPVLKDLLSWKNHPELGKIFCKLNYISDSNKFLDHWAEVLIARHLLKKGCEIAVEIPTPKGKSVDFEASFLADKYYLHVKRLNSDENSTKKIKLYQRLDSLHKINKPFSIDIDILPDLSEKEFNCFTHKVKTFILNGTPGQLFTFIDNFGDKLGSCFIVKEHNGTSVIIRGKPMILNWPNTEKRFNSILKKAYDQFMPNGNNIILISGEFASDIADLKENLKSNSGFWKSGQQRQSQIIIWFCFSPYAETVEFTIINRNPENNSDQIYHLFK